MGKLPDPTVLASFNVGEDDAQGLCQCGNFESLFRRLRHFLREFVAAPPEIAQWFVRDVSQERMNAVFADPYWRVAFQLHFSDELLNTMFGVAATQHSPPGSYPDYFRKRLERGLLSFDVRTNYFLHHIFLGRYLSDALPRYLVAPAKEHRFKYVEGTLDHVSDLASYDLVNLSNIMDWMAPEECRPMVQRLRKEMRPGAKVMWRQLNNDRDRCAWFGDVFRFDHQADTRLAVAERSMFYASIHVGTKEVRR